MLSFSYKKSIELQAGILYCEDRITGDELQAILQKEVEAGRREHHRHQVFDSPNLRSEGREFLLKRRKVRALRALVARRKVADVDRIEIKRNYEQGIGLKELHDSHPNYSIRTLYRIVSGHYEDAEKT